MKALDRPSNHYFSFALASCFLLHHGVEAYQLLVNDSSVDGVYPFYQEMHSILDENTSAVIGEMYQDYIYNANGTIRVGTHQGFAFNFDNGTKFNSNDILFLDDGEIYSMDPYIVSATGAYEKYQHGIMPNWKVVTFEPYAAQILLIEPDKADGIVDTIDDEGGGEDANTANDSMSFRVTSEGGYYTAIMNGMERNQIGQVFKNPIIIPDEDGHYHQNSSSIGINQGYSFDFPDDLHPMGNRQFLFGKGEEMVVFNEIVMYATGPYAKFTGAILSEEVISSDPNYVADIAVTVPTTGSPSAGSAYIREEGATYDFRITAEGGFYDPIQVVISEGNLVQIGERFQNPVFTYSGKRIGTNQGYQFKFPVNNFTREMFMGNRVFFLENGTLNVLNKLIVQATGIYSEFTGGRFHEVVVSANPNYVSEITLIPPSGVQKEEHGGGTGTEETVESVNVDVNSGEGSDGNAGSGTTSGGDSVVALFGLGIVMIFSLVQSVLI